MTEEGIEIDFNEEQLIKEWLPIDVTEEGMKTQMSDTQFEKR